MKPVRLKWQAFGPYLQANEIRFEELGEESLFLISGPTGGGKTSILDAMCFALYCRATGGRRKFESMRCADAPQELPTEVEFDFQLGENAYRFRRVQYRRRKRGTQEYVDDETHECFQLQGGEWKLLESGSEKAVRVKAEEILHLTCEQFSQVIVLPQGEFLKFLRASSKEKGEMLETLFSAHRWQQLTEKAVAVTRKLKGRVDELNAYRQSLLEKEDFSSTEEIRGEQRRLAAISGELIEQQKELNRRYTQSAEKLALAEDWVRAQKAQEQACRASEEAEALAQKAVLALEQAGEEKKAGEKLRGRAMQTAQEITGLQERYKTAEKWAQAQKRAAEAVRQAGEQKKEALRLQEELNGLHESIQKGQSYVQEAEESARLLVSLLEKRAALEKILGEYEQLQALTEQQVQRREALKQADVRCRETAAVAASVAESLESRERILRQNKAAELAISLRKDEPCPVCGSVHHPRPAVPQDAPDLESRLAVLREQKPKAEREAIQAQSEQEHLRAQLADTEGQITAKKQTLAQLTALSREEAQTEFEQLSRQTVRHKKQADSLTKARDKLAALTARRESLTLGIQEQNSRAESLLSQAETLRQEIPTDFEGERYLAVLSRQIEEKTAQMKDLTQQAENRQAAYEKAVRQESRSRAVWQSALAAQDAAKQALLEKQARWQEETAPDVDALREQTERYRQENLHLSEQVGNVRARLESVGRTLETLAVWEEELAQIGRQYAKAARLSESLAGSNPYKMPILQYVLSMMLDEILVYANRFFATLSRGRYALCRMDGPKSGNARGGLDLEVLDGYTMLRRSIETLSGGEQFLASLSLAFGLSDVVQQHSGAVQLDSLFIDEGFGTLDQETLDIAMKAIGVLRENGRMVGLISHVSELKQRIPAQITVKTDASGHAAAQIKR